jgi:hypothetical protein
VLDAGVVDQNVDAPNSRSAMANICSICATSDRSAGWCATFTRAADLGDGRAEAVEQDIGAGLASAWAMPRPMPLVEPVTSAVLP